MPFLGTTTKRISGMGWFWVNKEELMMDDGFGGVKCEETAHSGAVN